MTMNVIVELEDIFYFFIFCVNDCACYFSSNTTSADISLCSENECVIFLSFKF